MKQLRLLPILWVGWWWVNSASCQAQNLVPNPSFEQYSECPPSISMVELANGWIQPNLGTTDLFNTCSQGNVAVPANLLGYQVPHTGQGYAGIHPYLTNRTYREYVQVKLTQPLQKDSTYHLEFFVSLSNEFRVAISNLGAYFSVDPPRSTDYGLLNNVTRPPQVRNRSGYLTDTLNWTKIEGNFVATGGEQYLTIGNFDDDAHTLAIGTNDATYSYYYIDDVKVDISTCPIVTDLGPDLLLCPGDSIVLDATSKGASYRWQDGSTQASFPVKTPGMYWVDVQLANCSFRDSIQINYLAQLSGDRLLDTTLCANQTMYLDATFPGAIGYHWQDGLTSPSRGIYSAGSYWVDIEFGGCSYRDSLEVRYLDQANKLPDYSVVCPGQPVVLDATMAGASYRWQDGSTKPTFTATVPGYYSVIIQIGNCTFYDYAQVDYFTAPQVFYSHELRLCKGETTLLNASAVNGPYLWQDGSTSSTLLINQPGTYWVEFPWSGCLFRDSIRVDYLTHPPGDRLRDTTLCANQVLFLDASFPGAIGYRWQDGLTSPSRGIYFAGSYWVDIEFGGCSYRDSLDVRYLDQANKLPDYSFLCVGQPVVLDATTEGATYLWQDGSTQPTFTATVPGYYLVAVQIGNCTFQDYAQVDYFTAPQLFQKELTLCKGETTFLDVSAANGPYRWQDGSTESTFLINKPGKYWVDFIWYGCPARDSVMVSYYEESPHTFPKEITLCTGETRVLDASLLNSWYYRWQDGSTGTTFQVKQPGIYWVEFPWNNCRVRDSTTVYFLPMPVVTIKNDTVLCYGKSLVLQASGENQTFRWSDGSSEPEFTVKEPGTYWVESQDRTTGCTSRKTIRIQHTECWENLDIPNVITPNGDENNQYFVIEGLTNHWSLEIVNRWGNTIYTTPSYRNDWDASGHTSGVYYYHLRNYVSGQHYKGWLQVLR